MFGSRLRLLRKEQGYTLEELALVYNKRFGAGLNKGTLSKYEHDKQEPMISVAINLASIFQVPIDFLLGKTDCREFISDENISDEDSSFYDLKKDYDRILYKLENSPHIQYHNFPLSPEHKKLLTLLTKHSMKIIEEMQDFEDK